jgi:preprotein translocase subunit YajC
MLGKDVLAGTSSSSGGFNPTTLILIVIVVAAFYLLMIRPQQRRRQQAQQQQDSVQPGARVRTTAGMYATVVDVDGDDVVLEVAPGVNVRYMRRAVMDVVSPADAPEEDYTEAEDEEDADSFAAADDETGTEVEDETADSPAAKDSATDSADAEETAYQQATGSKKD